jgi:hypothetical protein
MPAHSLELMLKGKETTHWVVKENKETIHYYGTRKMLRWEIPLFVFSEGCLTPGHYGFPFSVLIPESLPGSFNFQNNGLASRLGSRNSSARIVYKLGARVIGEGNDIPRTTIPLVISQATYAVDETTTMEATAIISTWSCLDKGKVKIRADTDKATYITGETAVAIITTDNKNSELESAGFRLSLIRTIVMRDHTGFHNLEIGVISSSNLPRSIPVHHPTPVTQSLRLPITSDSNQTNTVQGQLIQCKYEIKSEVEMDGCMCDQDAPAVKKHVVVCPSTIPKTASPPLPEEWKPFIRTF